RFIQPTGQTGVPSKTDEDRRQILADAQRRRQAFKKLPPPYTKVRLREILTECQTDGESDFGSIASDMLVLDGDTFELLVLRLTRAQKAAQKYIKNHGDPKIGKLPSRVVHRKEHCQAFLKQIDTLLTQLYAQEEAAKTLIHTYNTLLDRNQVIPFGAADE